MRVELKADGYLYIYAENELESYTLRKYGTENAERPEIVIDTNISVKPETPK